MHARGELRTALQYLPSQLFRIESSTDLLQKGVSARILPIFSNISFEFNAAWSEIMFKLRSTRIFVALRAGLVEQTDHPATKNS
mmetsp:Transcript_24185/g.57474  ORF Transcript_24185/g.57474 Transcript_24185/m.57474 type:complete len:84 (+) Transcript_24185:184-435(+)